MLIVLQQHLNNLNFRFIFLKVPLLPISLFLILTIFKSTTTINPYLLIKPKFMYKPENFPFQKNGLVFSLKYFQWKILEKKNLTIEKLDLTIYLRFFFPFQLLVANANASISISMIINNFNSKKVNNSMRVILKLKFLFAIINVLNFWWASL